jgi:hypothetical protein
MGKEGVIAKVLLDGHVLDVHFFFKDDNGYKQ